MVRRAMSKKKAKDIARERGAFVHGDSERGIVGCVANGISAYIAEQIYDEIYDFANYAFNKAHAVCYAVVAYQTAWFKYHYPREYMAALLTSVLDSTDKISEYINECRAMGLVLLPPDVNRSFATFTVEEEGIRFGLVAIKNIGRGVMESMVREREENGAFGGFQDFCERMYRYDINKRAVENLIRAGAFDCFGARRSQLVAVHDKLLDSIHESRRQNVEGQLDFFSMSSTTVQHRSVELVLPDIAEFPMDERMRQEREVTGLYLSGHPMDAYRTAAKARGAVYISTINEDFAQESGTNVFTDGQSVLIGGIITSFKTKPTKNQNLMAYATIEDETSSIEILCFSRALERHQSILKEGSMVLVQGKVSMRDDKPPQIMCDAVFPLLNTIVENPPPRRAQTGVQVLNGKVLWIRLERTNPAILAHINRLIAMFPGTTLARIFIADTGKRMGTTCLLAKSLVDELVDGLGQENVMIQ